MKTPFSSHLLSLASACEQFLEVSSLRSLERYIAYNREEAKRKAREWERRQNFQF